MKLQMPRRGDSSDMAFIELVDREGELRKARVANPMESLVSGGVIMDIVNKENPIEYIEAKKEN